MRKAKLFLAILLILFSIPILAQSQDNLSPTEAIQAYVKASSEGDAKEMKRHLSQGTLKLMEDGAKAANRNLDEMLTEQARQAPPEAANIKYSNEKIEGDNATVDMTGQGQTVTMPLVKEDGQWKIALDKFIADMKAKLNEKP